MTEARFHDVLARHDADCHLFPGVSIRDIRRCVTRVTAQLEDRGVRAGDVLWLRTADAQSLVVAWLACMQLDCALLVLSEGATEAEVREHIERAGAGAELELSGPPDALCAGLRGSRSSGSDGAHLLLATSGSSGRPKIVWRSEASWLDEAERYFGGGWVEGCDVVAMPLALSHAYALGWVAACLLAGAQLVPVKPTALGAIARLLDREATVVALTPIVARMLVRREARRSEASRLRLAMVGAGPVDAALDREFADRFGVSLARNYGTTESGALFAGAPPLPPRSVGRALPGVDYRIVGPDDGQTPPGDVGRLQVRTGSTDWVEIGDLVSQDETGNLAVVGRTSNSVRRADQWVSPVEVEAMLRQAPGVDDVHVFGIRGGSRAGDRLIAEVVLDDPGARAEEGVRRFAATHLAAHKCPDTIVSRSVLRRSVAGKRLAPDRYLAPSPVEQHRFILQGLVAAYAGALRDTGVFSMLEQGATAIAVANDQKLALGPLELVLKIASSLGVLAREGANAGGERVVVSVEANTAALLDAVDRLVAVPRSVLHAALTRVHAGSVDARLPDPKPRPAARYRELLLGLRPSRGGKVLEISPGAPRYAVHAATLGFRSAWMPAGEGAAAGSTTSGVRTEREPEPGEWDVCIVRGCIHGPDPASRFSRLLALPARGGQLVFDDLFLDRVEPAAMAALGILWLARGGIAFPETHELVAALEQRAWRPHGCQDADVLAFSRVGEIDRET